MSSRVTIPATSSVEIYFEKAASDSPELVADELEFDPVGYAQQRHNR